MVKQKKIEKEARKGRLRSFHPAVTTLAKAEQELTLLRTLASHHFGIEFVRFERQADTFLASAPFQEGDCRAIALFVDMPGNGSAADTRCGLRVSYYVPGKGTPCAILTFSRRLKEPGWLLELRRQLKSPQPDAATQHVLRRLQASEGEPFLVRDDADAFKLQDKILKDYYEMVLIPRKAKA